MYLYWGAIILVLLVIFYIMRKEHMSEFRTVLERRQYVSGDSNKSENMDFGPALIDRAYIGFSDSSNTHERFGRCPPGVDPLEAQFMSSTTMLTSHNPCT